MSRACGKLLEQSQRTTRYTREGETIEVDDAQYKRQRKLNVRFPCIEKEAATKFQIENEII